MAKAGKKGIFSVFSKSGSKKASKSSDIFPRDRYVGITTVSRYLNGAKKKSIYKWCSESSHTGFPCHKIGKYLAFRLDDIDEYLNRCCSSKGKKDLMSRDVSQRSS